VATRVSPLPSPEMTRAYAAVWVLLYWALYFAFRNLFPGKALADAAEIQEIIMGVRDGGTGSYPMMAALYGLLPMAVTNALVGLFDGWVLYRIVKSFRTYRGALLMVPIALPFIFANLQAPTKETMILALTMFVVHVVSRARSDIKAFLLIVLIYALYGTFLRQYYLIILAVFIGGAAFLKTPLMLRVIYPLAAVILLLFTPDNVFTSIQSARDIVNTWAVTASTTGGIRTLFFNPYPPDNLLHFLGNYGYAFGILNFPVLLYCTPKELLMFYNILFYGWLMFSGLWSLRGPLRVLPLLFLSHVAVLMLFEPDLGSYYRHFSSCIWYLLPIFTLYEERRAKALLQRHEENEGTFIVPKPETPEAQP